MRRHSCTMVGPTSLLLILGFASYGAVAQDRTRQVRADVILAASGVELRQMVRPHEAAVGPRTTADIRIWKTITLGTYRHVNALREALDSPDCGVGERGVKVATQTAVTLGTKQLNAPACHLGDSASEIIGRPGFAISATKEDVNLLVLSVSELGFDEHGALLSDLYARAAQVGFDLCPAEVGPQLRLQYLDQPLGEFLHIAMTPIATYAGKLTDLTAGNGGSGLILVGGEARPDLTVEWTERFVFVKPRLNVK